MPRKSFVASLTTTERDQLNAEIRRRCYCDSVALADWLHSSFGVKTSKSAVQAYSASLKQVDGVQGGAGSVKALASMSKVHRVTDRVG